MRTFYDPVTLLTAVAPALIGAVGGAINKPKTPNAPNVNVPDPAAVAAEEKEAARRAALQERARLSARTGTDAARSGLELFAPAGPGSTRRTLGAS